MVAAFLASRFAKPALAALALAAMLALAGLGFWRGAVAFERVVAAEPGEVDVDDARKKMAS